MEKSTVPTCSIRWAQSALLTSSSSIINLVNGHRRGQIKGLSQVAALIERALGAQAIAGPDRDGGDGAWAHIKVKEGLGSCPKNQPGGHADEAIVAHNADSLARIFASNFF